MERTTNDAKSAWVILSMPFGMFLCLSKRYSSEEVKAMHAESSGIAFEEVHELSTNLALTPVPGHPGAVNVAKEAYVTPLHIGCGNTLAVFHLGQGMLVALADMEDVDRDQYMKLIAVSRSMKLKWRENRSLVKMANASELPSL